MGHHGRECRTSRYANRFSLPKAEKSNDMNTIDKYCTHCKKAGHQREECWSLNGHPKGEKAHRPKAETKKKTPIHTTTQARKDRSQNNNYDSPASNYSSSEEEESSKRNKKRTVKEYQVTQVIGNTGFKSDLELITLPVRESKKGQVSFLLDSGATLTLIKIGNLNGDTVMREEKMALTGVTGHKIHTLGKIRATITLGTREVRHTIYVVRDDFPIDYEGILGIDFLKKQKVKCDHGKSKLRIGEVDFKLRPYEKIILKPRSETIIRATTDLNK